MSDKQKEKIRSSLEELGQAFMYRKEEINSNNPLALVKAYKNKSGELEIQIIKKSILLTLTRDDETDLALKFVNRGYLYIIVMKIRFIDNVRMVVEDFLEYEKSRLRSYFRAEADIEFIVRTLGTTGEPASEVTLASVGKPDISGGGFFFYSKQEIFENTKVHLYLNLNDCGIVQTNARVVRCKPITKRDEIFGIAVEFIGISAIDREKILNFVSGIQRRQLMLGICEESRQWIE
jgi:hypothetical protein